ncbi:MAG TPA: M23 family metallopeptidase [Actinomycetota bacterium]|nr:M23 family metallopeptidase [Actinomycetota bacterium]
MVSSTDSTRRPARPTRRRAALIVGAPLAATAAIVATVSLTQAGTAAAGVGDGSAVGSSNGSGRGPVSVATAGPIVPVAAAGPVAGPAVGAAPEGVTLADVARFAAVGRTVPLQLATLGAGTSAQMAGSATRLAEYLGSAAWTIPVDHYELTARFDEAGANWGGGQHTGLDFAGEEGAPVVAARAGTVLEAGVAGAYGNSVVIAHPGGLFTRYAHLEQLPEVVVGQRVQRGQQIGLRGSTGNSTGSHLHFEVLRRAQVGDTLGPKSPIDPTDPERQLVALNPERFLPLPAETR